MALDDLTDEELMVMYQNGSDIAFQTLYARHSSKVYGYLKSRIKQNEKVTDIFQDIFIKIHKSKHLYNETLPALPWIFTITRTVLIDFIRKNKKLELHESFDFDNMPTPETKSSVNSDYSAAAIIAQLPETQKLAMRMRYIDDNTFDEIAKNLNITPTNVRKIISRGLQRLKQLMANGGQSEK